MPAEKNVIKPSRIAETPLLLSITNFISIVLISERRLSFIVSAIAQAVASFLYDVIDCSAVLPAVAVVCVLSVCVWGEGGGKECMKYAWLVPTNWICTCYSQYKTPCMHACIIDIHARRGS